MGKSQLFYNFWKYKINLNLNNLFYIGTLKYPFTHTVIIRNLILVIYCGAGMQQVTTDVLSCFPEMKAGNQCKLVNVTFTRDNILLKNCLHMKNSNNCIVFQTHDRQVKGSSLDPNYLMFMRGPIGLTLKTRMVWSKWGTL